MDDSRVNRSLEKTAGGLSASSFSALLLCLDDDSHQAALRYEKLRSKLIRLFTWRGCADAPDLADETMNRVAKRVTSDHQLGEKIEQFVIGVAHKIYLEVLRSHRKHYQAVSEIKARPADLFEREMTSPKLLRLEQCIMELPAHDRELILAYYRHPPGKRIVSRQQLKQKFALSNNNLRIKVFRIRNRLEQRMRELEPQPTVEPKDE